MIRRILRKLLSLMPRNSGEYVIWSIDPRTCKSKLYYSSHKALYQHYKRQFDAANKLSNILDKRKTNVIETNKKV